MNWRLAAQRTAWVAAVYLVLVTGLLLANAVVGRASDPLHPKKLQELQLALNRDRQNESLKRQARQIDRQLRDRYERHRRLATAGLWALLGGVLVFLASVELGKALKPDKPAPNPAVPERTMAGRKAGYRSVIGTGAVLGGILGATALLSRHDPSAEYVRAAKGYRFEEPSAQRAGPVAAGTPTPQGIPLTPSPVPGATIPPGAIQPGIVSGAIPSQPNAPVGGALSPLSPATPGTNLVPIPTAPSPGKPPTPPANANPPPAVQPLMPPTWKGQWPIFRGPTGVGIAEGSFPVRWNGAGGEGVLWKSPIELPGWNSPIVWQGRVFLSGANEQSRAIYCFDLENGQRLWETPLPWPDKPPKVSPDTGHCPATMATDGVRVYAIFVNGELVALDLNGKIVWKRALGVPQNNYGHASSLTVFGSGLLVQFDQGSSGKDGKSALYALDGATGKTVWQVKRDVPSTWTSPILLKSGGTDQLVLASDPWIIAYEPTTGKEIWRIACLSGEIAPSPCYGAGYVFAGMMGVGVFALRTDQKGDATQTGIAWRGDDGLPDIASPVCDGRRLYLCAPDGTITCYDAAGGKKLWEHSYETPFHASPTVVGDKVYFLDVQGVMRVLKASDRYEEVAASPLGEEASASPAFVSGRIVLRSKTHLVCVGSK